MCIKHDDLVETIQISSMKELDECVSKCDGYLFRGHEKESYKLLPSFLRMVGAKSYKTCGELYAYEFQWYIKFFRYANDHGLHVPHESAYLTHYLLDEHDLSLAMKADKYYWPGDNMIELGILAQHYGMKTRFLDWTRDFRIALYFASADCSDAEENFSIWCIDARQIERFRRNQLSMVEDLSTITADPDEGNHKEILELHQITQDNSIPLSFHIAPYYDNDRLKSQKGVLSLWRYNLVQNRNGFVASKLSKLRMDMGDALIQSLESSCEKELMPLDDQVLEYLNSSKSYQEAFKAFPRKLFQKWILPSNLRGEARERLYKDGIDEAYVYPGYESIARMIDKEMMAGLVP